MHYGIGKNDLLKVAVMHGVPLLDKNNIFRLFLTLSSGELESISQTSNCLQHCL